MSNELLATCVQSILIHERTGSSAVFKIPQSKLSESYENDILKTLLRHDRATFMHSFRVAKLSVAIASNLKYCDADLQTEMATAGLLHDVGKILVRGSILRSSKKLLPEEYCAIKQHPLIGYKLLSTSDTQSKNILNAVRDHHERLDGKGYPYGLMGDSIGLTTRIITVADSLDAMLCYRCYKKPFSIEYAKQELINGIGTQFDEEIAELAIPILTQLTNKVINL